MMGEQQMWEWNRKKVIAGILFVLIVLTGNAGTVSAAVREGKKGETITGEYAVIVNTDTGQAQSTGTLIFDSDGRNKTTSVQSELLLPDVAATVSESRMVLSSASVTSYQEGQEKFISSPHGGQTYVCIGQGAHCYVWMEKNLKAAYDAVNRTKVIAADMAAVYDGTPYKTLSDLCAGRIPYQDNSGKISILLEEIQSGASGIYKADYGMTAIHIDAPQADQYRAGEMASRNGLLVHEGQHALFDLLTEYDASRPYMWLNEGLSVAAMDYVWGGTDSSGWLDSISGSTEIRNGSALMYQSYRGKTAQDYAMPYLFIRYLIDRKAGGYRPMSVLPLFYSVRANISPEAYLVNVVGDGSSFSDILTEFYTAIIALEPDGKYGFSGDSVVAEKLRDYPLFAGESGKAYTLNPSAAIIVRLENGVFTVPENGGNNVRYMVITDGRGSAAPSGGSGSAGDPYRISSFQELNLIGNHPDAQYVLTQDIEADGEVNLTVTNFRGVLDGGGHSVKGLRYPLTGSNSGIIRNLTIEADMDGEFMDMLGIFSLRNSGTIKDCRAYGSVSVRLGARGTYGAVYGAFSGENEPAGIIRGCLASVDVHLTLPAQKSRIGGIVGVHSGTVENCSSTGRISVIQPCGDSYQVCAGGIAGEVYPMGVGGSVTNCIHTGSISAEGGTPFVGQICGSANAYAASKLASYVIGCYAKQGDIPAVGIPETNVSEESIILSDEKLRDASSYTGWTFGADWTMTEEGPRPTVSDDIQSVTAEGELICYAGEKPYNWGWILIDGQTRIRITGDMVSGFDSSSPGQKTAVVTFKGKTAQLPVTVKKPDKVTELKVSSVKHTSYIEGQCFNPDGVCLLAEIDGGIHYIYSGFDYTKKGALTAQDTSVSFSYYGAETSWPITVGKIRPSSVMVASVMAHTSYREGEALDLSDLRVQITYNNGTKTAVFGTAEFASYGVYIVKYKNNTYTEISAEQFLGTSDDGAVILICASEERPGNAGALLAEAGTVSVAKRMRFSDETLHMSQTSSYQYVNSENVTGGSGSYSTEVISENLPSGVMRTAEPKGGWNSYFEYQGIPAQSGKYISTYKISDTQTGETICATVTIHVHLSNEAQMFRFDLCSGMNPGLPGDICGIIGEDTILLIVPEGTDVTSLVPNIDYGAYMGVTVPKEFWNGTVHDFSVPVVYELTAPDKMTVRRYTVYVRTGQGTQPGEPSGGGSGTEPGEPSGGGSETEPGEPSGGGNVTEPGEPSGGGSGTESGEPSGGGNGTEPGEPFGGGSGTESEKPSGGVNETESEKPSGESGMRPENPSVPGTGEDDGREPEKPDGGDSTETNELPERMDESESVENHGASAARILPKTVSINGFEITISRTSCSANGKNRKPGITVMYEGKKLSRKYYSVKYSKNRAPGLAAVTVKGKRKYSGKLPSTKLHFVITPPKMEAPEVKSSKKGTVRITWKRVKAADGFQVQICRNKSFRSGVKTYELKRSRTEKTVPALHRKKTYYVRIRPFIRIKNTPFYGSWSNKVKVKVR